MTFKILQALCVRSVYQLWNVKTSNIVRGKVRLLRKYRDAIWLFNLMIIPNQCLLLYTFRRKILSLFTENTPSSLTDWKISLREFFLQ